MAVSRSRTRDEAGTRLFRYIWTYNTQRQHSRSGTEVVRPPNVPPSGAERIARGLPRPSHPPPAGGAGPPI